MTFTQQRRDYFDALDWVTALTAATHVRQLDAQTPCADFDVRSLLGHLIGTAHRGLATARGITAQGIPHVITNVPDDELASTYATSAASFRKAWSRLAGTESVTPPWGKCTALEAARGFTVETVTHGWDLAIATGQPSDAPIGADSASVVQFLIQIYVVPHVETQKRREERWKRTCST